MLTQGRISTMRNSCITLARKQASAPITWSLRNDGFGGKDARGWKPSAIAGNAFWRPLKIPAPCHSGRVPLWLGCLGEDGGSGPCPLAGDSHRVQGSQHGLRRLQHGRPVGAALAPASRKRLSSSLHASASRPSALYVAAGEADRTW